MRWRNLLSHTRRERDLEAEIRYHIATEERQGMDRGEPADDARANARRDFGNVGLVKEAARDAWGTAWIDRLIADIRYAIRLVGRNKSFALTVLLILTLGIGAATTVYALLNGFVLRDLPVPSPEELVWLRDPGFSYPIFQQVREQSGGLFQGMFAWTIENRNVEWSDVAERAHTLYVSNEFYPTLQQTPLLGRFVEERLYDMAGKDVVGLTIAAVIVLCVALAACYLPARRAVRVDPMTALRHQ